MTTQEPDDKRLLELIVQRDLEALGTLYDRYSNGVYALAMQMLRDSGAAEEVVQDVFHNVWRRASSYHPDRGKVTSWLFKHRPPQDDRRASSSSKGPGARSARSRRCQQALGGAWRPCGVHGPAVRGWSHSRTKEALNVLRTEQREVVMLAYCGGFTHSEIATRLDQSLGTVKTCMRLALKKLREVLGPQVQEGAGHGA